MFHTKATEKIRAHIFCSVMIFANRAVYDVMWKNMVEPDRPQITIWRMRIACWIRKATNNHSKYLMLIAFPLQQRLHERALMLHYTYSAFLVNNQFYVFLLWVPVLCFFLLSGCTVIVAFSFINHTFICDAYLCFGTSYVDFSNAAYVGTVAETVDTR